MVSADRQKMNRRISLSPLVRGTILFAALSALTLLAVSFLSSGKFVNAELSRFSWPFAPLLLFLAAARWFLDGQALLELSGGRKATGITLLRAASIRLQAFLASVIIPVPGAATATHVFLLNREKLTLERAAAVSVLRTILPLFIFILNLPLLSLLRSHLLTGSLFPAVLRFITLPLILVCLAALVLFLFADKARSLIRKTAGLLLHRCRFGGNGISRLERILLDGTARLGEAFRDSIGHGGSLLKAAGWILAAYMIDYFIAIGIIWSLGARPPLALSLELQFLMRPLIFFAFTPGGVGIWDFTYGGFFLEMLSRQPVGTALLLWRLLLTWIPCLAGGIILLRKLGRNVDYRAFFGSAAGDNNLDGVQSEETNGSKEE